MMTNYFKRTSQYIVLGAALTTFHLPGLSQPTFNQIHPIMVAAIEKGVSEGYLTGSINDNLSKQFKSNGPLLIKVLRGEALKQKGCYKLGVAFVKQNVPTAKGPTEAVINSTINYCSDGSAPRN